MSQSPDFVLQVTGIISGLQYTIEINEILAALGSQSKGPSAPSSPIAGQVWLDDTAATWVKKVYDGVDWILDSYINPTDNLRFEAENAYLSIASAATTDLGSIKSRNIIVSGAATITSFGTSPAGTRKLVRATGLWIITFSGSMVGPNGQTTGTYTVSVGQIFDCISQGGGVWNIGFLSTTIASRVVIEAASDLTGALSPGRAIYFPGMPKAWCYFDGTLTGTNPPIAGWGVTSITRSSAGVYLINWGPTWGNTNYCVIAMSTDQPSSAHCFIGQSTVTAKTIGQFPLMRSSSGGAAQDSAIIYLAAWGILA